MPIGSRAISMGSAYVAVADRPEAIFFNPAGLSQSQNTSLSFFISHLYGLKELTVEALSSIFPVRYGGLGITIQTFGGALYRESSLAFGFGRQFLNGIHGGVFFRSVHLQIQKYGSDFAWIVGGGCLFQLTDRLTLGFSVSNINHATIGQQRESIPQITRLGICYRPVANTLLSLEMDKDTQYPLELKGGFEIRLIPKFNFRCGFGKEPSTVSGGIGLIWNSFSLDYGLSIHPTLGPSHHVSLSFDLKTEP